MNADLMNPGLWLTVSCLVTLGVAHSALGEVKLIAPLVGGQLPPLGVSTGFAKRVLRFAWHLTSVAWFGLALATVVAPEVRWVVGVTLAISGLVTLVGGRGQHFAWALFLLGALGTAFSLGTGAGRGVISLFGAAVAFAIGALHVAWAFGVGRGRLAAIPQIDGRPAFNPGRGVTLLVAGALGVLGLLFLSLGGFVTLPGAPTLALAAAAVFALRTVGDFRTVGLFKRPARNAFARNDALLYTPLCFSLAAALLWLR